MLDLNRIFANQSLATNPLVLTPSLYAGQTPNSFAFLGSFNDALSNIQTDNAAESPRNSQSETLASATLVQQFQTESSLRTASSPRSDDGDRNQRQNPLSQGSKAQASSPSKATSSSPSVPKDDDYQKQEHASHSSAVVAMGGDNPVGDSSEESPAQKLEHHKEAMHGGDAGVPVSAPAAAWLKDAAANQAASSAAVPSGSAAPAITDPVDTVSSNNAAKTSTAGKDLAFAVRIQGTSASPPSDSLADSNATSADVTTSSDLTGQSQVSPFAAQLNTMMGQGANQLVLAAPLTSAGKNDAGQNGTQGAGALMNSAAPANASPAEEAEAEAPSESASAASEVSEEPVANAQPVKSVQVQITGSDNQRVDLKLIEKAGSLTMSVRSSDGTLSKALRQSLPELSGRLSDQQIRAEWWRPDNPKSEMPRKPDDSPGSSGSYSSRQDQGGQSGGNFGQRDRRGASQPDWVEELSDPRNQTGTQYSWHL